MFLCLCVCVCVCACVCMCVYVRASFFLCVLEADIALDSYSLRIKILGAPIRHPRLCSNPQGLLMNSKESLIRNHVIPESLVKCWNDLPMISKS